MGLLAVIALAQTGRGDGAGDSVRTVGRDEARANWAMRPTSDAVKRYPRSPLPRTFPGDWIKSEDYPSVALNNDLEGSLSFRVSVDPYGEVLDCVITRSSGVKSFDQRTCATISTRARFYPAFDADQQPVVGTYSGSVRWQIPDESQTDAAWPGALRGVVDANGQLAKCEWIDPDPLSRDPASFCQSYVDAMRSKGIVPVGSFTTNSPSLTLKQSE